MQGHVPPCQHIGNARAYAPLPAVSEMQGQLPPCQQITKCKGMCPLASRHPQAGTDTTENEASIADESTGQDSTLPMIRLFSLLPPYATSTAKLTAAAAHCGGTTAAKPPGGG